VPTNEGDDRAIMSNTPQITQNFARPSYRPETTPGIDPDMRRMALVAAGFGGAVALVIGAFSLSHHVHHGVPVIEPMAGPVRVKPADPGGMKVAGAEDDAAVGTEKLAPPPEEPELHALRAKAHPHVARPAASPVTVAQPAVLPPIAPAPAVQQAAATRIVPPAAPTRDISVQIGAFESEQAATQDWGKSAERMPSMFDGHTPKVERTELAGHTVWRLRTGGFATVAAATEFCQKIRAKGGDCSIAAF
jgi:hypothetical protein